VCLMLVFVRWKLLSLGHSFPIILFLWMFIRNGNATVALWLLVLKWHAIKIVLWLHGTFLCTGLRLMALSLGRSYTLIVCHV
jgi:hypothetical protein